MTVLVCIVFKDFGRVVNVFIQFFEQLQKWANIYIIYNRDNWFMMQISCLLIYDVNQLTGFCKIRSSRQDASCEKGVLTNFLKFNCSFIKIETLVQLLFSEFWEISKNTFSYRTYPVAASIKLEFLL